MIFKNVGEYQDIQYRNVISRYYTVSQEEMPDTYNAFLEEVRKAGYTLRGPFFYTINSKLEENQDVLMELFIPVEEEYIEDALPEDFLYHSLFQVLNTVSTRILEPDDESVKEGISFLAGYIYYQGHCELTPPFFFTTISDGKVYTDIKVGVLKETFSGIQSIEEIFGW
ncbi:MULTISPECIES: DUF5085 family protein [Streptococcus mitis group]|jgi:hypothetical protein|uniref:DUF5085 family protein n=1 Tax=Streptococcus mitis group TaxID=3409772 RepID=UPI0021B6D508|nr:MULTISPECIES: DUF5085 family protein [Streptococcus]MDB0074631.1 DUF5085 family protein [Streptococcus gwangjuense]